MNPILHIREQSIGYPDRPVLTDVDLVIRPGERIAILGRSGAGKSTLLNLIYTRVAEEAALIPQAAALVRSLSVFHNVFMGRLDRHPTWFNLKTLAWPGRREVDAIRAVLDLVGLDEEIFRKAGALSGGQQQRTSVARALYTERPIVIGDEPVSALDASQGAAVLRRLSERHETTIVALHDVDLALAHATRILGVRHGRIALDADPARLGPADLAPLYEI